MKKLDSFHQWALLCLFTALIGLSPFNAYATTSLSDIDLELSIVSENPTNYTVFTHNTFTIVLKNMGTVDATGVNVHIPFPSSQLAYTSSNASAGNGSYNLFSNTWNVGTLAPNATAILELKLFVLNTSNDITLFAQVQSANETDADSTPGNDTDQTPDEDDEASITLTSATTIDLELTAEFEVPTATAGQTLALQLTITNKGPAIAENVKVYFDLSSIASGFSIQYENPSQGNLISEGWNVGTLASGQTASINFVGIAGLLPEPISFFAQVQTATPIDIDSTPGNNTTGTPNEDDEALATLSALGTTSMSDLRFIVTSGEVVSEGDIVTLTVNLINEGPDAATAINVVESIPSELSILNVTATGIDSYNSNTWYIDELPSGDGATLELTVQVGALTGPISYFAQVQSVDQDDPDSTPGNNTTGIPNEDDEVSIDLVPTSTPQADLELKILDFNTQVAPTATTFDLVIEISNNGPETATGIVVSDMLPNNIFLQGNPFVSQGTYNGDWIVGDLASGESAGLVFNGFIDEFDTPHFYFAQIQTASPNDPDSTPGNDTDQTPDEDDEVWVDFTIITTADLDLTAQFDVATAEIGDFVDITVEITNNGPVTATNVVVSDVLPSALAISAPTVSKGTYNGDWIIGELANGESATLTFNGLVEIFENPIIYFAQVQSVDQDDPDSTPGSDTAQLPIEDDEALAVLTVISPSELADLRFIVTSGEVVSEGDIVTLTVNLINEGPDAATAINVVESIPSELTILNVNATGIDSYNSNTWYIDELPSGDGATLELTVEVGALTGPISYFAQVQSVDQDDPDSTPGNNTTGVPNEDDEVTIDLIPPVTVTDIDLELNMNANVSEFNLYQNVTYTIEVTNNGPANASGVQVATMVPAGMAFTSKLASKGSYNLWAGVWTVGDLALGETATLEVVTFTLNNSGSITNFAQVKAAQQNDSDSSPNNNNTNIPVEDDEAAVTIIPAGSVDNKIDLALSKSANVSTAKAGDAITYTLVIVNNGTAMATGVSVEDVLPSNLTYTGSTASKGSYDETTGIWDVTMLPIGGGATLNIHATVDVIVLPMTNFAQVKTANETDVDSTPDNNATTTPNEDDEDSVTILPDNSGNLVDIELTAEFSSSGQPGSPGTLYLTISNNGPADAVGVTVAYDVPSEYFSSTYELVSKGSITSEGWTVGNLASGETASIIFEGIVQLTTQTSIFFAQVQTASPQDSDSTPGNDTDQTPDEDDETKLTFFPSGSTDIDLEASMTSSQPNLSLYSNITFTLKVTNKGAATASGVLMEFPIPSGMAFTSKIASQGSYNLWSKVWTVGTLQPNETATLDLTLFVLNQSVNKTLYAEVIGANENDIDSTPNNGVYQVVAEDDEAAVTVLANSGGGGKNDLEANIVGKSRLLTVHRMFPVPTQNTVNLLFSSEAETIDILLYDYTGRLLHSQTLEVLPDVNTTQLDLTHFPAGVYYISMETEEGNVRTKVVKQ